MSKHETVLILGASSDPQRYANKAMVLLKEHGHRVVLVNPNEISILGQSVYKNIEAVTDSKTRIDTVTMYVNPKVSENLAQALVDLKPKRVIFNPGSENGKLISTLKEAGIEVEEACTLVLLHTNQF